MKQIYTDSTWAIFAGMRFLLAFIVLVGHLQAFITDPAKLHLIFTLGGKAAVLGFLLISGVSIAYSYTHSPNGYFQRRFLRIYPLYISAVILTCIVTVLVGSPYQVLGQTFVAAGWKTSLANMFFLQGILAITITYNGPLWTLAVEVLLYLFAPLFSKSKLEVLILLIGISMILFLFYPQMHLFGYGTMRYAWAWLIGFVSVTHRRLQLIIFLLCIGIVTILFNKTDTSESLSWVTFSIVSAMIVLVNVYEFSISRIMQKILNFLGELSYPVYLFHFPIYMILYKYLNVRSSWVFIADTLIVSILLNYIIDYWFKDLFWKPLVRSLTRKKDIAIS